MTYGVATSDFPEGAAIVFGGSGGLGSVAARLFAERGANVVVTYFGRPEAAQEVVADIEASGRRGLAVQCDVKDRQSVDAVISSASAQFGRVHTILSSQGGKYATGPFYEAEADGLRRKLETDILGFLNVVQSSTTALRAGGGGSITAVVSPAIKKFVPGYGLGVTPKAGVASMVAYFAGEEGKHGIRVNAVAPGVINAGMALTLAQGPAKAILDRATASTPLGRMGEAGEVAELLAFLASTKAGYITGQIIMVDGGFSL